MPRQPSQRPRKPTLGTPGQGNPSSCLHPALAQGSLCQSILPLESVQPNPTAPAKRLGAEPRRCSAIPTVLGRWVCSPPSQAGSVAQGPSLSPRSSFHT